MYEDVDDEEKDSRNPIKCLLETEMKKFMEMMREERREICLFGRRGKIILRCAGERVRTHWSRTSLVSRVLHSQDIQDLAFIPSFQETTTTK